MFFAIGFALGINSVLIPVLQGSLGITSAESYLIIAATFVPVSYTHLDVYKRQTYGI